MVSQSRSRGVASLAARLTMAVAVPVLVSTVAAAPAVADPVVPPDAPVAVRELAELNHRAEVLTEEWHAATADLARRRAEAEQTRGAVDVATAEADRARDARSGVQREVDVLTDSVFRGARFDEISALLASDSQDEVLERMAALDVLGVDRDRSLRELGAAARASDAARIAAQDAATRAALAEIEATETVGEIDRARLAMDQQIALVQAQLGLLTAGERQQYIGPGITDFDSSAIPGDDIAARALRVALTRQGAPYVWGATGPGTFDCSGLVQWSYRQVGVILPRPSREQARVGTPITPQMLRPGDLIALNTPVSHIGMYVGGDQYLNAPQSGDVVKVARVPWGSVTALRRIG